MTSKAQRGESFAVWNDYREVDARSFVGVLPEDSRPYRSQLPANYGCATNDDWSSFIISSIVMVRSDSADRIAAIDASVTFVNSS